MLSTLLLLLTALSTSPVALETPLSLLDDDGPYPVATLPVEDEDHGSHLQGETYEKVVKVDNTGTASLVIEKVNPSCGCVEILEYPESIAAGKSGEIRYTVNTKKIKPGDTRKNIRIFTNDPYTPKVVYWFDSEVIPLFRTMPSTISVSGVVDQVKETVADLVAASDLGFEILELKSRHGKFEIVESNLIDKDRRYRVKIRVGPAEEPGRDKGVLDMTIRVRDGRTVTIGTWVEIHHRPHILVQPEQIYFSNKDTNKLLVEGATPISKSVMVAATSDSTKFEITSIRLEKVPEGVFATKVQPVIDGKRYQVQVTLSEYQKATYLSGKLIIETNDRRLPKLELSLRAMFGRRR
ncbi:MAG: DUF1573 domain-containing protein [Planctomycetota bacterium]